MRQFNGEVVIYFFWVVVSANMNALINSREFRYSLCVVVAFLVFVLLFPVYTALVLTAK
jgi:hypothetical protein